tara:strand:- start:344 stop:604 length:261 start_codon:yes stop_codon:yes gene_type:complete
MKLFVFKSLVVCLLFFLLFHLTFGYAIRTYENKIYNAFSKDKILFIKEKIRAEVRDANKKENILDKEDAKLFGIFIKKILSEINQQ